jgi:hypothetical protein
MFAHFVCIRPILLPIGIFYTHLVYFMVIWYISPHFGMLYQEKSGNPAASSSLPFLLNFLRAHFNFFCFLYLLNGQNFHSVAHPRGYIKRGKSVAFCTNVNFLVRVARWFVFKPKIPIWVNFGGPSIEKCL